MKRVLILAFSDLNHDARILRQISFLKDQYKVSVICFNGPESADFEIIRVKKPALPFWRKAVASFFLITRMYLRGHYLLYNYEAFKKLIAHQRFDLVIANDIESLPFSFELGIPKVFFDAHEYAPRHFEDKWVWRVFFQGLNKYLCRTYLPRVAAMTTVGQGLATEYEKEYGIAPTIITNAAPYASLQPSAMQDGRIRLVHHGGANPSRRLELMIELVHYLDERFTLDMILVTPQIANRQTRDYLEKLRALADQSKRVRILTPLKSHEIVAFINQYDMGIFLLPPVNFNYANTLPNKLFDFIQARLAIAIGPTPEMAAIVRDYQIGVVSEDFQPQSLARQMNQLSLADIQQFKINTQRAAQTLNAEANKIEMNAILKKVLS